MELGRVAEILGFIGSLGNTHTHTQNTFHINRDSVQAHYRVKISNTGNDLVTYA